MGDLPVNSIVEGNCLDVMKTFPSNSIDVIVTDPPYALVSGEYKRGQNYSGGFMNKKWDSSLPSVEIWKECLRVLKEGGFAFIMSAPRADLLSNMILNIQEAGFAVDYSPIYFTYSSGFPKPLNLSKATDKKLGFKREEVPATGGLAGGTGDTVGCFKGHCVSEVPISEEAKILNGSYGGFQPKPAVEVIIVAMKPITEKTITEHAIRYARARMSGKNDVQLAGTWLNDCRVPWASSVDEETTRARPGSWAGGEFGCGKPVIVDDEGKTAGNEKGRFPANLVVSDDVFSSVQDKGTKPHPLNRSENPYKFFSEGERANLNTSVTVGNYGDAGSFSRYFDLDRWYGEVWEKLPEQEKQRLLSIQANLDKSSSIEEGRFPANLVVSNDVFESVQDKGTKPHPLNSETERYEGWGSISKKEGEVANFGDAGSFSRYFDIDRWFIERVASLPKNIRENFPFLISPKASRGEKEMGLESLPEQSKGYGGKELGMNSCPTRPDGSERKPVKQSNFHPTVKPLSIGTYLVTLGSREGDIVLDPFNGSGTFCIAASILGRRYIGIDLTHEYVEISKMRLAAKDKYFAYAEKKGLVSTPTEVSSVPTPAPVAVETKKEEPSIQNHIAVVAQSIAVSAAADKLIELVEEQKKETIVVVEEPVKRTRSGFSLEL